MTDEIVADAMDIYYFGDQSCAPFVSLRDLLDEARNSSLLPVFLRSTFDSLQAELASRTPQERATFKGRTYTELLDHVLINDIQHVAVTTSLSCVVQLGWLLLHRERHARSWDVRERRAIGVCTGELAAIATITAISDSDLLHLAPLLVRISLRLGFEVARRSDAIDPTPKPWAASVSGIDSAILEKELLDFNKNHNVSTLNRIYISADSASSTTLSGPPSLLEQVLSAASLSTARKLPLPIYGAFHAEHLPLPSLDAILGDSEALDRNVQDCTSLVTASNGQACSLRELLGASLQRMLSQRLRLDEQLDEVHRLSPGCNVHLIALGPARIRTLEKLLKPKHVTRMGDRLMSAQTRRLRNSDIGDAIAVIGMAGRFPGADNVDELWKSLIDGVDQHKLVPMDRFDVKSHVDDSGKLKNTSLTPYGCFYDRVGDFDISLFKMSPREAAQTDPSQRMMLLTAYEALESAGYYDTGDSEARPKHGTFYGVAGDDYRQANSSQNVDTNYITGGTRAFGPGRVSYYLGWEGPSMTVDAACSASAVAMHQAITSVKTRQCDMALAGGSNLLTCSDMFAGLSRAKFVCTTGPCKTFDETADGYCRADGFATVVFKRLSDAVRDKDNVLGVIRSAETYHAGTAISLTHPEADTQCALFRNVLATAGLTMDDIDHVELHGTGTQAGDMAESTSVYNMLRQPRPKDRPLTISSVKPNVGHSEAASGVTSLIKGLLMLQHRTIPRHIGVKTRMNPKLPPFDVAGIVVPSRNMPFPQSSRDGKRRMLVNNFNATGGITAMLLEEYIQTEDTNTDVRGSYPVCLSAATATALKASLNRLLQHIRSNADISLSHLSYTLTARRLHHKFRFACVANTTADLEQQLAAELSSEWQHRKVQPYGVFVFTGQTSTIPRARVLYETNAFFRDHVQSSDRLCREMKLPSFISLITGNDTDGFSPVQIQLALVALQISLSALFQSWGVQPRAVIGHSLGEYSALCVSKVLSLADTLWLVGCRSRLLEAHCQINKYSMVITSLSAGEVSECLKSFPGCELACVNAPSQTVLSGKTANIDEVAAHLAAKQVKAKKLQTPYGFHSQQMDVILDEYIQIASGVTFRKPGIPVASSLLGKVIEDEGTFGAKYLCQQTREPVRFEDALLDLEQHIEAGSRAFWLELGTSPACLPMIVSTIHAKSTEVAASLDLKKPTWRSITNAVAKFYCQNGQVRWDEYHREHLDALRLLQLPSYPFDLKKYWIQYDGDWMIRKNQKVQADTAKLPSKPELRSVSLHRVANDVVVKGLRKLTFSTDCTASEILPLCQQSHIPFALFADMAISAATYVCQTTGQQCSALEVSHFEVKADCSLTGVDKLQTIASQLPTDTNIIKISVESSGPDRKIELATCTVCTDDVERLVVDADHSAYLYQSRMDLLQLFVANGQSSRLSSSEIRRKLVYHNSIVDVEDVITNTRTLEVTASMRTRTNIEEKTCKLSWLQAVMQIPSLALNASASSSAALVSWESMHLYASAKPGQQYRVHAKFLSRSSSEIYDGDVHVLDEDNNMVASIKKLSLKHVEGKKEASRESKPAHLSTQVRSIEPRQREPSSPDPLRGKYPSEDEDSIPPCLGPSSAEISDSTSLDDCFSLDETELHPSLPNGAEFGQVLETLAAELGVEVQELTDDVQLEDLGVDSIVQISAVASLQKHAQQPLPSALLLQHNTIAKLKQYFADAGSEPITT